MNLATIYGLTSFFQLTPNRPSRANKIDIGLSREIIDASRSAPAATWPLLRTSCEGLTQKEADARLVSFGPNQIARESQPSIALELGARIKNPLNALLLFLAVTSYSLGENSTALMIFFIVLLAIVTAFIQEHRSNSAAAKLRALVKTNASVKRKREEITSTSDDHGFVDIPFEQLVPGDVVHLSAGDMIPADLRITKAKDLFINQSALTGEAMPAEKSADPSFDGIDNPFDLSNICFMGSSVVSGFGEGVIVHTAGGTYFGQLADKIAGERELTSFDKGINRFTWLMIRFMLVMAPAVFLINGLTKHDWLQALLFSVAVAVGLTPEMLPMIVTVNLAKGALAMSKKRVIVKRLNAIQNFGAMDVLCADKTGTLTEDRITLKRHLDIRGGDSERVLEYAYLNSHYQSGLKNLLDVAVLQHVELGKNLHLQHHYKLIDEIPFDFVRRRLSVALARENADAPEQFPLGWMLKLFVRARTNADCGHLLICKGAVEEIFSACKYYELDGNRGKLDPALRAAAQAETVKLNADGFRVIAVAYKEITSLKVSYSIDDEIDLTLLGYIAFMDPPKESSKAAIAALNQSGVTVKIITGDNDVITRTICREVGIKVDRIVLGPEIEAATDKELCYLAESTAVFAKVSPTQKARVIRALQSNGHVVGFLGDGINDSPSLKAADIGLSVEAAVDIAKESADIILLEKNLMVLHAGVMEGRKVFGNLIKYIKMSASSNFGTMFGVLGASLFLPFVPMLPIQVLTNNLLYDFSQTAITTDNVDADYLAAPRKWDVGNVFKFMMFIGPISSIFDYATFFVMLYIFKSWTNPSLFQTGWFVESLLSQTLIIHIIRTAKIPFLQSRASVALIAASLIVCAIGLALPYTPLANALKFTPLPTSYWNILIGLLLSYAALTQFVKTWFVRRWGM
jgi:Mg2+-importing ATPase